MLPNVQSLLIETDEDVDSPGEVAGSDPEDQTLTFEIVSAPEHGTVEMQDDGTFVYRPESNWWGEDSFSYRAYDGGGYSEPATVQVIVHPVNDRPKALADDATVAEDGSVTIPLSGQDVETPTDELIYELTRQPEHGTVSLSDGEAIYTPDRNYNGTDSFAFRVIDTGDPNDSVPGGDRASAEKVVSIDVTAVNDRPRARAASGVAFGTETLAIELGASDVETPASQMSYIVTLQPEFGTVEIIDGVAYYTADPEHADAGEDYFEYAVRDTGDPAGTGEDNALTSEPVGVTIQRPIRTEIDGRNPAVLEASVGLPVVIAMRGPGRAVVYTAPEDSRTITRIELFDTTERSLLVIGRRAYVSVGEINVHGSLDRLIAPTATLDGELNVDGTLRVLFMDDATDADIHVNQAGTRPMIARFDQVHDTSIHSMSAFHMIYANEWLDTDGQQDMIYAPSVNHLLSVGRGRASGDFEADVTLTSPVGRFTLGRAVINGDATGDWRVSGDVGTFLVRGEAEEMDVRSTGGILQILLGASYDSDFLAGVSTGFEGRYVESADQFVNDDADILRIVILGIRGEQRDFLVSNSNFSASRIRAARLLDVDYDNGGDRFGLHAESITRVFGRDGRDRWIWPSRDGVFAKPDLDIRII
jgi:hypothetical protein